MKKLVFAAFAAMAIVSASNVFAFSAPAASAIAADTDTVAPAKPDTVPASQLDIDTVAPAKPDTVSTPSDPAKQDSLSESIDTVAPATPDSVPVQK